jgi:hypothetical protein
MVTALLSQYYQAYRLLTSLYRRTGGVWTCVELSSGRGNFKLKRCTVARVPMFWHAIFGSKYRAMPVLPPNRNHLVGNMSQAEKSVRFT